MISQFGRGAGKIALGERNGLLASPAGSLRECQFYGGLRAQRA
jgi:hypothetical protein